MLLSVLDEMGKGRSITILEGVKCSGWNNIKSGCLEVEGDHIGGKETTAMKDTSPPFDMNGVRRRWYLEPPLIRGEIVNIKVNLGIQDCYGSHTYWGDWEKTIICCRNNFLID